MDTLLAAVDLGSNSFRLSVGRIVEDALGPRIVPLDRLKETVRLAAGLDEDGCLDEAAMARAETVLARFGERLRGFPAHRVRAVATNTFRVARNSAQLLTRAQSALGFPVEIISGFEEARLIYSGVAHSLPAQDVRRLVVDVGGGSTEVIIGQGTRPIRLISLPMGCVSFSRRYFPDGRITAANMRDAQLAARRELEAIVRPYRRTGWQEAYGSSGTGKALYAILTQGGYAPTITADGLRQLQQRLVTAGRVLPADLPGIKPYRTDVLPGGLAIMRAVFDELGVAQMQPGDGALRVGVLYDMLGRDAHDDTRELSVQAFMRRYHSDARQAARVREAALAFFDRVVPAPSGEADSAHSELRQALGWAADLHEIGRSIAHEDYHHHSAYILAHADMSGFSNDEQALLALLVVAHQGKLTKVQARIQSASQWLAVLSLRLAVLLMRRRTDMPAEALRLHCQGTQIALSAQRAWLARHPLTDFSLRAETAHWRKVGYTFALRIED